MSRVGKAPIAIPDGVEIKINGNTVTVKGPKGELRRDVHPEMKVVVQDKILKVERPSDDREHKALHGLTRSLLANMVEGVVNGYKKVLVLEGVGYRAALQGKMIVVNLDFSIRVEFDVPDVVVL